MDVYNEIVFKIKKIIDDKNLTRVELSRISNINRSTLYNYLDGKTELPLREFIVLCNVLNVSPCYFFDSINYTNQFEIDKVFDTLKEIVKRNMEI